MSVIMDNYNKILKAIEELEKDRQRSIGILEEIKKEIKEKYGCNNLKQLKRKLKQLKKKEIQLYNEYVQEKERFIRKWKPLIEGSL